MKYISSIIVSILSICLIVHTYKLYKQRSAHETAMQRFDNMQDYCMTRIISNPPKDSLIFYDKMFHKYNDSAMQEINSFYQKPQY